MLMALLTMAVLIAACSTEQQSTLVAEDGEAPYYTSLADAQAAARADQYIVAEFYTDW
jgi:hypothetical protein